MYYPKFYKGKSQEEIAEMVREEGFNPVLFNDDPGYVYKEHQHPQRKLLAFLKGSMKVKVKGETFNCHAGDRVLVPGNTPHTAKVGRAGCTFFWSEKV
jgi:quercetin dioxygenase-like cupin family protein